MDIFLAPGYREFISDIIRIENEKSWGAVKRLAEVLKCHSTYISQIVKGKSHLSTEQAIAFCSYLDFSRGATDHFLDLLNRDKSGTAESRTYFQDRIERRLAEHSNLKQRLSVTEGLTLDQEARYYNGWLPQVVHICSQLPGAQTLEAIAAILKIERLKIAEVLSELEAIGIIEITDGVIRCLRTSVYIGKDSPFCSQFHMSWRLRTLNEMATTTKLKGVHYSSVLTMSTATAEAVQELIVQHLSATRELVLPSPSDHIYSYCLDFYPITHPQSEPKE